MVNLVGQQLGHYRLTHFLGRGGFADVYLGEQVYLESQAAIKVLSVPLAPEAISGFQREARILAQLIHPHIVRLLDYGIEDQMPYLVMEYASGGSLRERYPIGQKLPLIAVMKYVRQIAEALLCAHRVHLTHRDVKPANLLLGKRGHILLSDFGIASTYRAHDHRRRRKSWGQFHIWPRSRFTGSLAAPPTNMRLA